MQSGILSKFINKFNMINYHSKEENNNEFDNLNLIETIDNSNSDKVVSLEEEKIIENGENVLEEFGALLNNMNFKDIEISEVTISDNDTFVENQHDILGTRYIFLNVEGSNLRIVTGEGKSFIIDTEKIDSKIYAIIFSSHIPRKICVDSPSIFIFNDNDKNGIYDISLIVRIFYGKHNLSIKDLVSLFMEVTSEDYNTLAYNLFRIKDEINIILDRNRLMQLLNKETKVLEIVSKCQKKGLPFSEQEYTDFKSVLNSNYELISNQFVEKYDRKLIEKFDLITMCNDNGLPTTINIDYLERVGNNELLGEVMAFNLVHKYNNANLSYKDDRLYLDYNSYNQYGNIQSSFAIDGRYIVGNDNLIIGKYLDLYLRIFANECNIVYVVEAMNKNTLLEKLSERLFGKVDDLLILNTLCILKGSIHGHTTVESMADFILDDMDTYIDDEEVALLQNYFNEKCPEVIEFIDTFDKYRSNEKRHSLDNRKTLHRYIKLIESDIFKSAITLIYDNIQNYNRKNKNKIYLVGLLDNKIVLEADDKSIDVAVDILNRNLTKAYEQYITKVQVVCITSNGKKLK